MTEVATKGKFVCRFLKDSHPEGICDTCHDLIPGWDRKPKSAIKIQVLHGGVTNKLFKCSCDGEHALCRIYGNYTEQFIDRSMELLVMRRLEKEGRGRFYGQFSNGFLYGYIEGRPLKTEDIRSPMMWDRVAEVIAAWHKMEGVSRTSQPVLFPTLKKYLSQAKEGLNIRTMRSKLETIPWDALIERLSHLEELVASLDAEIVFCHNDLLAGNFILSPSEKQAHLVDYEYAGYNYTCYELANHFCEFADFIDQDYSQLPSSSSMHIFLYLYLRARGGIEITADLLKKMENEIEIFSMASHFWWGLWALIQLVHSDLDVDYFGYAQSRFAKILECPYL
eukprot:TRINITY_DN381_c0_g5_i1.p1 TRINITY_DN381_c0_g5~~TRINITY_DN381_c0_g5_i1.p1  ORF type:complete len:337 (+),score=80.10 TRINITY_DN381_c0_g5_i1:185-1195(+)